MSASRLVGVFENNENSFRVFELLWVVGCGSGMFFETKHVPLCDFRSTTHSKTRAQIQLKLVVREEASNPK